jgi:UDP-glucuronate decarboxylase
MTGSLSKIVHRELPHDDPKQRQPDIAKARELLGWAPVVSLEDGLKRTIDYFDRLLADGRAREVAGLAG